MNRFILSMICLISAFIAYSQTENGTTKSAYAELLGYQKGIFSKKVTVSIDFGQKVSFWKQGSDDKIVDENGKDVVFNSMVDAMNFMGKRGWKFVQAYVVTEGNQNVYHWLLSKEIVEESEILDGFQTKAQIKGNTRSNQDDNTKKRKYEDDIYNR